MLNAAVQILFLVQEFLACLIFFACVRRNLLDGDVQLPPGALWRYRFRLRLFVKVLRDQLVSHLGAADIDMTAIRAEALPFAGRVIGGQGLGVWVDLALRET